LAVFSWVDDRTFGEKPGLLGNKADFAAVAAGLEALTVPARGKCAAMRAKRRSMEIRRADAAFLKSKNRNAHIVAMQRFSERHSEQSESRPSILIPTQ
jgi:hypothetical protein